MNENEEPSVTEAELARVAELDAKATPEPWRAKVNNAPYKCVWLDPEDNYTTLELKPEDADLIAEYRTITPRLARELAAARARTIWAVEHCALVSKTSRMKTRRGGLTPDNLEPGFVLSWMSKTGNEISMGAEDLSPTIEGAIDKAMQIEAAALNTLTP